MWVDAAVVVADQAFVIVRSSMSRWLYVGATVALVVLAASVLGAADGRKRTAFAGS